MLEEFERIKLGHFPTPIEHLKNMSKYLGGPNIFIKRDDCTGLATGGNKTRKLEFLMPDAIKNKADYLAFGAFNKSKTKRVKYRASINLLKKARKITKSPIVAIGGINSKNYKKLLLNKANFLAISGYIWNNKKLNPKKAINKLV